MASTKAPPDDGTSTTIDPAKAPANDDSGKTPAIESRTDEERELSERVRRKIKRFSSKTKRDLN